MVAKKLINWYKAHARELPWRETKEPYKIWLSEIILQQTRVAQGLPYYQKFVEAFPTVFDLARAPEQKVMKLWQGLGYYSRARNLHATAKAIAKTYNGKFPSEYAELKKLKGVGDYTAAAISSFCFNRAHAVVDGNVFRVLSRLYAIGIPIDSVQGKKEFTALANELLDKKQPGLFNQAIMEFGAVHCTPVNPACDYCFFAKECQAYNSATVEKFPLKEKKTKVRTRYFEYFFIEEKNSDVYIQKRENKDIWQGLWQLPLLEFKNKVSEQKVLSQFKHDFDLTQEAFELKSISASKTHLLSHQKIVARFWHIKAKQPFRLTGHKKINLKNIGKYPFPVLIGNHLREISIFE